MCFEFDSFQIVLLSDLILCILLMLFGLRNFHYRMIVTSDKYILYVGFRVSNGIQHPPIDGMTSAVIR